MIKAPYNFIPLSDKVVMPFWAKYISQDIPFKDAKSGTLRLKIKAESPIYVRNGVPRNAAKRDPKRNDFNNIEGNCFLPGSSIKGMLRSVVEIMSFGRMRNKVNDDKYSVRDFQNNDIYPKTSLSNQVKCGWLYKEGEEYFIDKCGKPGRISHKNLDSLCNNKRISTYYKNSNNVRNDKDKSAKSKNAIFSFGETEHRFILDFEDMGRKVYKLDPYGDSGSVVLTGQSSARKESEGQKAGKHLEFIFWDKKPTKTHVSDEVIKNFFFAYYDHDKNNQKDDWRWRKEQLKEGEKIPIFYRTHRVNGKEEFQDIGLTMLYKITYNNSILDSINQIQKEADAYDLSEAIFGYVDGEKALKGRVHVGHAFVSNGKPTAMPERSEVLAGPKASYYPNYIEQNPNANGQVSRYKTFMDNSVKIRGWKRYPVRRGSPKSYDLPKRKDGSINYDVLNKFIPLPASTEFELNIAYHNLRQEELGAIISAITFHNTKGLYHSIGSAKPLGYGKVKISIEGGLSEKEKMEALKAYEEFMDYSLGNSTPLWFQSNQIKELTAMAKPGNDDAKLEYMELTEFVNQKGRKKNDPSYALQRYSLLNQNKVGVQALSSTDDLNRAKVQYAQERKEYESLADIKEQAEKKSQEQKSDLNHTIEILKDKLLRELEDKKKRVHQSEQAAETKRQEEERLDNRNERQAEAKQKGFTLTGFDTTDRDAFNNLGKEILKYARNLHNKNENQLKKDMENSPWVQVTDFELVKTTIKEIRKNTKKKSELKKWNSSFKKNHYYKKISEWLGGEQAQKLFNELTQKEN